MNKTYLRSVGFGIALLTFLQLGCSSSGTKTTPPPVTPQITQFSASPTAVTAGTTTTITWATTNAASVTIAPAVQTGTAALPTSGSATVTMTATTTYTITATASNGTTATQAVTVTVTAAPIIPVINQFTASPTDVNSGQTSTITWATTNAASVAISPAVPQSDDSGPLPTSGSSVAPILATTTYTLTATSSDGTTATATVTVNVPFTLSLSVSPATITAGSTATLSWQITAGTATALSIDNGVCSPCTLPSSSATVKPNVTTTYTATATASDGSSITATATLTVSPAPLGVIKHIFYMLQENRSFDMYFGQLPAWRTPRLQAAGITDTSTIDVFNPSVTLTNHNTTPNVTVTPFHEATVCTENLSPAWDESHHDVALNGGDPAWATTLPANYVFSMNNFLDTANNVGGLYDPDGTRAMGYYNQTDLPYYYDLASFFATSDTWHSPILANTVPNRMYLMAATSFGHEYPDNTGHPLYAAPTIFHAMNTANVSWLYYYKDGIFLANFLDFTDTQNVARKTFPVSDLLARLGGSCSGTPCNADQALPEVIFIDSASGGSGLDEHPDNNIQSGAAYVQSIISALMQSTAWYDSIFILTYDESGGLYDHVAPFVVPEPDSYQPGQCPDPNNGSSGYCAVGKLGGQFNLTGLRVPMIVISPYAKPNFVSHVPRDYTAILAYIEKTFNVTHLTDRDNYWLLNPQYDMSEFFDLNTPALLTPPASANTTDWTKFLATQPSPTSQPPSTAICDQTKEAGPHTP